MEPLRTVLRRVRDEAWLRAGGLVRARAPLDGSRAVVLCYHRVLPREQAARLAVEPGMFVTPPTFARHLAWLRDHFSVLPLGEIAARLAAGRVLPAGACAISFDDGWRDNHEHAWPALRAAGVPATIFLVTSRVGTAGGFWPDEACRRLAALPAHRRAALVEELTGVAPRGDPAAALLAHCKALDEASRNELLARLAAAAPPLPDADRELLSWEEVAEMASGGIDFESHGQTHAILPGLDEARQRAELEGARETLRARGLGRHDLLAYPSGAFDDALVALARRCGIRAAVTTLAGPVSRASDPLRWPRVLLHEDVASTRAGFLRRIGLAAAG